MQVRERARDAHNRKGARGTCFLIFPETMMLLRWRISRGTRWQPRRRPSLYIYPTTAREAKTHLSIVPRREIETRAGRLYICVCYEKEKENERRERERKKRWNTQHVCLWALPHLARDSPSSITSFSQAAGVCAK